MHRQCAEPRSRRCHFHRSRRLAYAESEVRRRDGASRYRHLHGRGSKPLCFCLDLVEAWRKQGNTKVPNAIRKDHFRLTLFNAGDGYLGIRQCGARTRRSRSRRCLRRCWIGLLPDCGSAMNAKATGIISAKASTILFERMNAYLLLQILKSRNSARRAESGRSGSTREFRTLVLPFYGHQRAGPRAESRLTS